VQARSEAPLNDGWGNKSQPIVQPTDDGLPTAPMGLQVTSKNMTCLSISWAAPAVTNGHVISYKVSIINVYSIGLFILHYRLCYCIKSRGLAPLAFDTVNIVDTNLFFALASVVRNARLFLILHLVAETREERIRL
jgi:hypothetical protein